MKKTLILLFLIISYNSFSQRLVYPPLDSLGKWNGYSIGTNEWLLIKNERRVKYINVTQEGRYVNGREEGVFGWFDDKGNLVGESWYDYANDTSRYEIHYLNKKIISFIRYEVTPRPDLIDKNIPNYIPRTTKIVEIISYDKKGRIKKRHYTTPEGKEVVNKYNSFSKELIYPPKDSLGRWNGYAVQPEECLNIKDAFPLTKQEYIEVISQGYYVNGEREGFFDLFDYDGNLVCQTYYHKGLLRFKIRYFNKRVLSFVIYKNILQSDRLEKDNLDYSIDENVFEIIDFDNKGRIKLRDYRNAEGGKVLDFIK